jgi:diaminopimelate decarboxylase
MQKPLTKQLPFSTELLKQICSKHNTPFYLYDEQGIRNTCRFLKKTFTDAGINYRNYFAVKVDYDG